jgi:hypothetical protein
MVGYADTPLPCQPSSAQSDGQPSGGQLAAWGSRDLAMVCPAGDGNSQEELLTSVDGGLTWEELNEFTVTGTPTSLTASTTGVLVLSATSGIYTLSSTGVPWKQTEEGPPGGFSYVGMTNATQGVAVPAEPANSNSVWYTKNAGASWTQSSLTNP